jgi:hypothetical protein
VRRSAAPRLADPGGAERPRAGSARGGGAVDRAGAWPVRGCARGDVVGGRAAGRPAERDGVERDGAERAADGGGADGGPETRERARGAVLVLRSGSLRMTRPDERDGADRAGGVAADERERLTARLGAVDGGERMISTSRVVRRGAAR